MNHISRRELGVAMLIALMGTVVLQIPYTLGYALARPGTEFTGLMINVEDGSYLSAIGQGINGAWLYRLPFTTEEHAPAFIEEFYLALGHLARLLNLSAVAMWHAARAGSAMLLFLVLFGFMSFFIQDSSQRRAALLLAVFGAGWDLAWLPFEFQDPLSAAPLDWRMPESHLFFSALTYPHYAINISLVIVTFWLMLRALTEPLTSKQQLVMALTAAGSNFLLGLVYPFFILLPAAVLSAYYLFLVLRARRILWRQAIWMIVAFMIPAPLFLYYQSVLLVNPVLRAWNDQAVTLSPNPLHYLMTYAPYLLMGIFTFRLMWTEDGAKVKRLAFLWIWVAVNAVLLYMPINPQRRFVQGLHVPFSILAMIGLWNVLLPRLAQTRVFVALSQRPNYSVAGLQRLVIVGVIALVIPASVYVWISSVVLLGLDQPYPLFRPRTELEAMDWLGANTAQSDVVLSSYWTGSLIPARAGNTVFIGQRYETIRFEEKRLAAEKFFGTGADDAWRIAFLRDYKVAYVFWGRGERDLGAFDPSRVDYLQQVFSNDSASVYRVRTP